jgi:hypothetical protein
MEHALSPATLAELRRPRPYPAVSVLTPTHRREPRSGQDPVRLRNMLAEARKRLESDPAVTRGRRADVATQLDRALAEVDLTHVEDGLVIFAAPGEHQVWSLGRTVPERVVLSDTFLTRNLVAAQTAERPFWVLSVSADRVTLWSGGPGRVAEDHAGGFPRIRSQENFDAERRMRVGEVPSTFRDEGTRQFLREADTAMNTVLREQPRPVYVTGEQAALSLLDEVGSVARAGVQVRRGGLAHAGPEAVWQAIRPVLEAETAKDTTSVVGELTSARGHRTFAAGLDELWQSAREGRVRLLAVEENYRVSVRDLGVHLVPAEPGEPESRDDIVDEIVEQCLETGAAVRFVPDGVLGDAAGIAGVLRY